MHVLNGAIYGPIFFTIKFGVRQGSVLSPIFLQSTRYIDDVSSVENFIAIRM